MIFAEDFLSFEPVGNGFATRSKSFRDRSENTDSTNGMVKTIPYSGNPFSVL